MQFNLVNNKEQALYLCVLLFSDVLRFSTLSPVLSSLALPTCPTFVPTTPQHASVPTVFEKALLVGDTLPSRISWLWISVAAIFLTYQIYCRPTFIRVKTNCNNFGMVNWWYLKCWTSSIMVLFHYHPGRWEDLSRYKLLTIQTVLQYPGHARLDYDLAFCKDAAASGLIVWSKMNGISTIFISWGPLERCLLYKWSKPRWRQALREVETRHHLPNIATRGIMFDVIGRCRFRRTCE